MSTIKRPALPAPWIQRALDSQLALIDALTSDVIRERQMKAEVLRLLLAGFGVPVADKPDYFFIHEVKFGRVTLANSAYTERVLCQMDGLTFLLQEGDEDTPDRATIIVGRHERVITAQDQFNYLVAQAFNHEVVAVEVYFVSIEEAVRKLVAE